MKETSATSRSGANGRSPGSSSRALRAVEARDARVAGDPVVQLAAADVQGDDPRGAALQQAVGEAAGRGADVERVRARDVPAEPVEHRRELVAAARDEPRRVAHVDGRVVGDRHAGLRRRLPVHA